MLGDTPKGSVHSGSVPSIMTSRFTKVFLLAFCLTVYIFGYAGYGFYSKMELASLRGKLFIQLSFEMDE